MNVSISSYYKSNLLQRRDAQNVFREYSKQIQWRADGKDTVLDIGCGPGDVTMHCLVPILPKTFSKVVGVDLSENMVKHANSTYSNSRTSFGQWDMAGDVESLLSKHPEGFDHIFSHYALHWHSDYQRMFDNIFKLLNPNGDCLLVFLSKADYFEMHSEVASRPKWKPYFKKAKPIILPFHSHEDRVVKYRALLESTGFGKYTLEEKDLAITYNSLDEAMRNITAIDANIQRMDSTKRDEFYRDLIDKLAESGCIVYNEDETNCRVILYYNLIVIHASK